MVVDEDAAADERARRSAEFHGAPARVVRCRDPRSGARSGGARALGRRESEAERQVFDDDVGTDVHTFEDAAGVLAIEHGGGGAALAAHGDPGAQANHGRQARALGRPRVGARRQEHDIAGRRRIDRGRDGRRIAIVLRRHAPHARRRARRLERDHETDPCRDDPGGEHRRQASVQHGAI